MNKYTGRIDIREQFFKLSKAEQEHLRDIWTIGNYDVYIVYEHLEAHSTIGTWKTRVYYGFDEKVYVRDWHLGDLLGMAVDRKNKTQIRSNGRLEKIYPCYSADDMIRLLEQLGDITIGIAYQSIELLITFAGSKNRYHRDKQDNLCDALWEAVRWCLKEGLL